MPCSHGACSSLFRVAEIDEELHRRLDTFDIHPTGPLWGRGEPGTLGQCLAIELAAAHEFKTVAELLEEEGLSQERRALRCAVRELDVEADAGALTLSFSLNRGQFATAVLREICDFSAEPALESDMDGEPVGEPV
jgi:tRNA pseudouridine13 synthase